MKSNLPPAMQEVGTMQWSDVGVMWAIGIGSLIGASVFTAYLVVKTIVLLPYTIARSAYLTVLWLKECYKATREDTYDYSD